MVVANHVVVGVPQMQGHRRRAGRQTLRRRHSGIGKPGVLKGHPHEPGINRKGLLQPESQVSLEQLPVISDREREPLRVPADADVGALAVKDQVVGLGQPLGEHGHFLPIVRLVGRELPNAGGVQAGDEFVPVVVADHRRPGRYVAGRPFGRLHRRMFAGVYLLEGDGVERRGQQRQPQQRQGQGGGQRPEPPGRYARQSLPAGNRSAPTAPIPAVFHQPQQHPRRQQHHDGHQREDVAQEADLEVLQEQQLGHYPAQQQQVPTPGGPVAPRHNRCKWDAHPGRHTQRDSQAPHDGLAHLVQESRGVNVLDGEGPQPGVAGHVGLRRQVVDKGPEIQQGVGGEREEHRQRRQPGQRTVEQQPSYQRHGDAGPTPPGGIQQPAAVGNAQRDQQRQHADLGRHRQSHQRAQQERVAQAPPVQQAQHPPKAEEDEADGKSLGPVEVAVLDVDYRQGHQPGGQQARVTAKHSPAQHVDQEHAAHIGQRGQRTPGVAQVKGVQVGEGFDGQPDDGQNVNQAAAQGEPVGIQRAAFGVKEDAQAGKPGLGLGKPGMTGLKAGSLSEQVVHTTRPQVEGTLVGVEPVASIPIYAVKPQRRRHGENQEQCQTRRRGPEPPGQPAPRGKSRLCHVKSDRQAGGWQTGESRLAGPARLSPASVAALRSISALRGTQDEWAGRG